MTNDPELPHAVTAGALAVLTGLTDRQIRNLAAEGVVEKADRGRYVLAASIASILARARTQGTDATTAARADYAKARAEAVTLATAERRRELILIDEHYAALDFVVARVRSEFAGLPARFTRDMPLRQRVETEINSSLNRVAAALEEAALAVKAGSTLDELHGG